MDKLKRTFASISTLTTRSTTTTTTQYTPSTDLTPTSSNNRLKKYRNPFEIGASPDSIDIEPDQLGMFMVMMLTWEAFVSFVVVCCLGSLAGFQKHWGIGVSGLIGFMLFLVLVLFFLSIFLLVPPILFNRYDKLGGLARFLKERRSQWVLQGLGVVGSLFGSVVLTASAWSQKGCKNPEIDPHSSLGDEYMIALLGWCRTKKASSIFMWMGFAAWLAALIYYIVKNRGAVSSLSTYQSTSGSGYRSSEVYGAATEVPARFISSYGGNGGIATPYDGGYSSVKRDYERTGKAEVDEEEEGDVGYAPLEYEQPGVGAAVPSASTSVGSGLPTTSSLNLGVGRMTAGTPTPRTESTKPSSRTMQLAKDTYDDPYAAVKASLTASPVASPQAQGYGYTPASHAPYDAIPYVQHTPGNGGYR